MHPDVTICALMIGAAISAMLHLVAEYRGPRSLVYVAKPLTTSLLVVAAVASPIAIGSAAAGPYRSLIVVGLLLSLAGDIFLMLPHDHFMAGLGSFLLAHVAYIVAFSTGVPFGSAPLLLVPFVIVAMVVLRFLWPTLGKLRGPVLIYVAALMVMAWQATTRAVLLPSPSTCVVAAGAVLFVVSDGTLAFDRFRVRFRAAQFVVMTTYVLAQMLITLSISLPLR